MPLPLSDCVAVEDWALLMNVSVAVSVPATRGLKVTLNGRLCPAWIVTGSEIPLTTKAVLLALAAVTVTLAPLAVKLPEAFLLVPTTTLPMPRLLGLIPSCAVAVAVPVPDKGIVRIELGAFDVIVTLPPALAAVVGEKLTLNVALCPAARLSGAVIPLKLNPSPLAAISEMVTLEPPVLVSFSDKLDLFPTWTLPKLILLGLDPSEPAANPMALSGIVRDGLEASDVIVTVPLALPAAWGAKATVKAVFWPVFKVNELAIPLISKPTPLAEICEI